MWDWILISFAIAHVPVYTAISNYEGEVGVLNDYGAECVKISFLLKGRYGSLNVCKLQSSLRECKQVYVEDWVWFGSIPYRWAMWSDRGPEAWRYRLYFSTLLSVISVGRDWSVHSVLKFNAIKENLRIMSDMESICWTVLLRNVLVLHSEWFQSC